MISGDDYQIARFLVERGLAVIYCIGFVVAAIQFRHYPMGVASSRAVIPALARFRDPVDLPLRYSDQLRGVAWTGAVLCALVVLGSPRGRRCR